MKLQLLLICPECEQTLTREEMVCGHDCEVSGTTVDFLDDPHAFEHWTAEE